MRLRATLTVTVEYEADVKHYSVTDPLGMAKTDQGAFEDEPHFLVDMAEGITEDDPRSKATISVVVVPVVDPSSACS
jgi:hypothetical protein